MYPLKAIEYPKSKFAPWANLILYEASWFSIAVEKEKTSKKPNFNIVKFDIFEMVSFETI